MSVEVILVCVIFFKILREAYKKVWQKNCGNISYPCMNSSELSIAAAYNVQESPLSTLATGIQACVGVNYTRVTQAQMPRGAYGQLFTP